MSKSGQQHPKADVGGRRDEPMKPDAVRQGARSVRDTLDAGKKQVAKSDAKK